MSPRKTQRTKRSCVLLSGGPFPSLVVEICSRGVLLKLVSGLHNRRLPLLSPRAIPFSVLFFTGMHSPQTSALIAGSSDIGRTRHPAPASTVEASCPVPPPPVPSASSNALKLGILIIILSDLCSECFSP